MGGGDSTGAFRSGFSEVAVQYQDSPAGTLNMMTHVYLQVTYKKRTFFIETQAAVGRPLDRCPCVSNVCPGIQ